MGSLKCVMDNSEPPINNSAHNYSCNDTVRCQKCALQFPLIYNFKLSKYITDPLMQYTLFFYIRN